MAVLCPVHGEGVSCPMVYKTLNIGQGESSLVGGFIGYYPEAKCW